MTKIPTVLETQAKCIKFEAVENRASQCREGEPRSPRWAEAGAWLVLISEYIKQVSNQARPIASYSHLD